ncbi:MAG: hypothetical protein ACOC2U_02960 [bacterium]
MKKNSKQRLYEVMSRLDKTFKPINDISENIFKDDSELNTIGRNIVRNIDPEGYKKRWEKERPGEVEPDTKPKAVNTYKKDLHEQAINPNYTHFAFLKKTKKFINGWDFADIDSQDLKQDKMFYFFNDIIDMNDINPKDVVIGTAKKFQKQGLDPFDANNWYKFEAEGWRDRDDLNEMDENDNFYGDEGDGRANFIDAANKFGGSRDLSKIRVNDGIEVGDMIKNKHNGRVYEVTKPTHMSRKWDETGEFTIGYNRIEFKDPETGKEYYGEAKNYEKIESEDDLNEMDVEGEFSSDAEIKEIYFRHGDVADMIVEFEDGTTDDFVPGLPDEPGTKQVIRLGENNKFTMPYFSYKTGKILMFNGVLEITSKN